MDLQELESIMAKYNLTIRRFPTETIGLFEERHYQEGDEYVVIGKKRCVRRVEKVSSNIAGKFALKVANNTMSIVEWPKSPKRYVGDTIEDCVRQFMADQEATA